MGAFLAKPVTDKSKGLILAFFSLDTNILPLVTGKGDTYTYGGCSMQGWRVDMEDAHTTEVFFVHNFKH